MLCIFGFLSDYYKKGIWINKKGSINNSGYLTTGINNEITSIHKLIAETWIQYPIPKYLEVDHINNIKTDNKLNNLQLLTKNENSSKEKQPKSGYTGVSKTKNNKYKAKIEHNNKCIHIGTYNTAKQAHKAYQEQLNIIKVKQQNPKLVQNIIKAYKTKNHKHL